MRQDEHQEIRDIEKQELESLFDSQIDKLNRKLMLNILFVSQLPESSSEFVPISSITGIHRFDEIDDQSEGESEDEKQSEIKEKDISPRQQSMNERDKMFAKFNRSGFTTKKPTQMESLNMSKSTVKRKKRQLREKGLLKESQGQEGQR